MTSQNYDTVFKIVDEEIHKAGLVIKRRLCDELGFTPIQNSSESDEFKSEESSERGEEKPWRLDPPSAKQLYILDKHGVRYSPTTLTKGEASDLISELFEKEKNHHG